jgi:hypothetical protein
LTLRAPELCLTEERLERELARIAGSPYAELAGSFARVDVSIEPDAEGWTLLVQVGSLDGATSERSVRASSCEEAADAAAVVLATTLSDRPSKDVSPAPVRPETEPAPLAAPEPAVRVAPLHAPRLAPDTLEPDGARESVWLLAGARLGADIGTLPSASGMADLVVTIGRGSFAGRTYFGATATTGVELTRSAGGANVSLVRGGVSGCYGGTQTLSFWACAGLEAGILSADGYGVRGNRSESMFWPAAGLAGGLRWRIGPNAAISLESDWVVPFRRVELAVLGAGTYQTTFSSVRPFLGLEMGW